MDAEPRLSVRRETGLVLAGDLLCGTVDGRRLRLGVGIIRWEEVRRRPWVGQSCGTGQHGVRDSAMRCGREA